MEKQKFIQNHEPAAMYLLRDVAAGQNPQARSILGWVIARLG